MPDRGIVTKGLECHINPCAPCSDCPYDDRSDCDYSLLVDALELLKDQENEYEKGFNDCLAMPKEQEGYVSVPFSWLVKFCTHIDFKEPVTDEERELMWKQKLKQQFGIELEGGS